ERELSTAQGGLHDREEARTHAEHQVVLLKERAAGLTRRADEARAEAARMRERLAEVAARDDEARARLAVTRAAREAGELEAQAAEQALSAVESELRRHRETAADRRQLSLDLFSAESEKRGACERIRERDASLRERRELVSARVVELEGRLSELLHSL